MESAANWPFMIGPLSSEISRSNKSAKSLLESAAILLMLTSFLEVLYHLWKDRV